MVLGMTGAREIMSTNVPTFEIRAKVSSKQYEKPQIFSRKVIKGTNSETVTKIGFAVMYQLVLIRTEGGQSLDPCSNFTFGFDIRNAKYFPWYILAITSNR